LLALRTRIRRLAKKHGIVWPTSHVPQNVVAGKSGFVRTRPLSPKEEAETRMWEELWAKAVLAESRLRCTGSERAAPVEADLESKPEPPVETSPASYPCGQGLGHGTFAGGGCRSSGTHVGGPPVHDLILAIFLGARWIFILRRKRVKQAVQTCHNTSVNSTSLSSRFGPVESSFRRTAIMESTLRLRESSRLRTREQTRLRATALLAPVYLRI
jgi:hypothetical protein